MSRLSANFFINILMALVFSYKCFNKAFFSGVDANNALCWASEDGHLDIVKYLVEHGANIHFNNALSWALEYGHLDVVKYLVNIMEKEK